MARGRKSTKIKKITRADTAYLRDLAHPDIATLEPTKVAKLNEARCQKLVNSGYIEEIGEVTVTGHKNLILHKLTSKGREYVKKEMALERIARSATLLNTYPDTYVVIDVETSGRYPYKDEIIEIGAIMVEAHCITERFSLLVRPQKAIVSQITKLTGITNAMLQNRGIDITVAMPQFVTFLRDLPVVGHNVGFDFIFLNRACAICDLPLLSNRSIDTLTLSRRKIKQVDNYKLITLAKHFLIATTQIHRSLSDCEITYQLYEKLIILNNSDR